MRRDWIIAHAAQLRPRWQRRHSALRARLANWGPYPLQKASRHQLRAAASTRAGLDVNRSPTPARAVRQGLQATVLGQDSAPVTIDTGVALGEFQKVVKVSDIVADYGSAACPRHVIEGSMMARSNSKTQRQGSYGITSSQCQAETSLMAA